jgi:DNA-binding CsgD family transcriptional regulator
MLTARELECLREVGAGKSDREIGTTLGISRTTVKYYLERARLKLGARTRAQAYARLVLWGDD